MAAVWYIGDSSKRIMSEGDWAAAGTEGATVEWMLSNGWSVPKFAFSEAQIFILEQDSGFWTEAPDGNRVWSQVPGKDHGSSNPGSSPVERMLEILAQAQAVKNSIQNVSDSVAQVAQDRLFVANAKGDIEEISVSLDNLLVEVQGYASAAAVSADSAEEDKTEVFGKYSEIIELEAEVSSAAESVEATHTNVVGVLIPQIDADVQQAIDARDRAEDYAAEAAQSAIDAAGGGVTSMGGFVGAVTLAMLGLDQVDNTRDSAKPISTATQAAINNLQTAVNSSIDSVSTAVTARQTAAQVTTAINNAITALVGSAPSTLDTLQELAAAMQADQTAVASLTTAIGLRAMADAVVNILGDQSVSGIKNFTGTLQAGGKTVVVTDDARLSDTRNPKTHQHVMTDITDLGAAMNGKVNTTQGIGFWAGTQAAYDALPTGTKYAAGFIAAIY